MILLDTHIWVRWINSDLIHDPGEAVRSVAAGLQPAEFKHSAG